MVQAAQLMRARWAVVRPERDRLRVLALHLAARPRPRLEALAARLVLAPAADAN